MSKPDQKAEFPAIAQLFDFENTSNKKQEPIVASENILSTFSDDELFVQFLLHSMEHDFHKTQKNLFLNAIKERNKQPSKPRGRPKLEDGWSSIIPALLDYLSQNQHMSEAKALRRFLRQVVENETRLGQFVKTAQNELAKHRKNTN